MGEQQLCDQRRQIEEKHWLEELEMKTIKQKIEGQSTEGTEVAPVVQIIMSPTRFEELLALVAPRILKSSAKSEAIYSS